MNKKQIKALLMEMRSVENGESVDYLLGIIDEMEEEKIQKIVNNYGVNNAIILFQELVKQITSLDIVGSISSYEFRFPGSLK